MVSLKLFGGASLEGGDGALTGPATQRHRLALLALLATTHPRGLTRDKLLAYLWPERDAGHARNLLSQAVHALRKALGERAILSSGDELRLDAAGVEADVVAFEEALAAGELERAVSLYAGPFLDGFFLSDAPEFERWVEGERLRLRHAYQRALEGLAEAAAARGDVAVAVERWRRLAGEEPYSSRLTLRLMEALEAAGDRAGAIQQARQHTLLLQEEFEAEPDAQVTALAERLRTDPAARGEPDLERGEEGNGASNSTPLAAGGPEPIAVPPAAARPTEAGATAAWFERDSRPTPAPVGTRTRRPWPVRSWVTALGLLGLGGLAVLLTAFWLRQESSPTLHPRRVVVAPFENRTGDPSLDPLGSMAADWITQGFSRTGLVEVVPPSAALTSARHVQAAVAQEAALNPLHALAEETGAGLVISGAYYLHGDSLRFQVQITDARQRKLLRALEPIGTQASAPMAAIQLLRQRTLGALAPLLDARLSAHAPLTGQPPSLEAYRAYAEGMDLFIARDFAGALEHLERAVALDSSYLSARLVLAWAHLNVRARAEADSISRMLDRARERLTPFESASLNLLRSFLRDDPVATYEAAKRAAELAPGSLSHVQWAVEAVRLNRPREAIRILSGIDPTRGELRGHFRYWSALAEAHHRLGEHRRELRVARRARALYPDDPAALQLEAVALAALGRIAEVQEVLDARLALPEHRGPNPLALMMRTAFELRAHGDTAAARQVAERGIAWFRGRAAADQELNCGDYAAALDRPRISPRVVAVTYCGDYGAALQLTGRQREAEAVFRELAAADPEHVALQGILGMHAARRGDQAEAERVSAWLAAQRRPDLRGNHTFFRACIAAELGRKEEAVGLLREAFSQGVSAGARPHFMPCFDPVRGYPPFRELMRPKG